ncbi:protein SRC2-like [Sesamum indicum]|uniref:Protein SRC2-like n=1 Tax=Sesamum indicum TaxID=4182 RepID=A0A6I9U0J9_SESIN|nr:protein SRC2-like [Sesamum indicum]
MEYRTLDITLQYAKDLNKVNFITKMDVYAVVSISGGDKNSKQKTKTPVDHDGDDNPTWNFPMKFTVDEAALQMNRLTLDFKLICERALGDKDVGEVHVPIKELLDSPAKPGADGKQFVSYQVRKPSGKPKGQLSFSYQFSEKTVGASAAPPHASAIPLAPPSGKADTEAVTAYPAGPSLAYPPPGAYPPLAPYPAGEGGAHYPPPAPYPAAEGSGHYPPPAPYTKAEGSGHYPPPGGYPPAGGTYPPPPPGGYGYPPPPPGYGYPPPPPPGYGYPPQPGYGYPPQPPVQQAAKKNKFGMGLGAGLLGGAIGGLLVGDMISDAADFDGGFDF